MSVKCPKCNVEMSKYSPFIFASKKKNYSAVFVCPDCKRVKKV